MIKTLFINKYRVRNAITTESNFNQINGFTKYFVSYSKRAHVVNAMILFMYHAHLRMKPNIIT